MTKAQIARSLLKYAKDRGLPFVNNVVVPRVKRYAIRKGKSLVRRHGRRVLKSGVNAAVNRFNNSKFANKPFVSAMRRIARDNGVSPEQAMIMTEELMNPLLPPSVRAALYADDNEPIKGGILPLAAALPFLKMVGLPLLKIAAPSAFGLAMNKIFK